MDAVTGKRETSEESLEERIAAALVEGALPGETSGLEGEALASATAFVAKVVARQRQHGAPLLAIESTGIEGGRRRMRLAAINDDMPFLVDSVAGAIAAHGLAVDRVLHPVLSVRRDASGALTAILPESPSGERRESIIYMEVERADARVRRALEARLLEVLADVRAAVSDWPRLQIAMRDEAERMPDGEGAALLRWFLDRHFTLLGHQIESPDGSTSSMLGVLRVNHEPLWSDAARTAALAWYQEGGDAPLILKSDRVATVHRRAPLDLIVLPVRRGKQIAGLSIHAGLWTSAALRAPSEKVPVLRARLTEIEEKFGFDPAGHAGKALRHALSALPHDLLIAFSPAALETVALTAMSLADRPRPKLVLVAGVLRRHLFAFVWMPRDELSTSRRLAIGELLEQAAGARVANWSLDLEDGGLALIRYMLDLPEGARIPDAEPLDRHLEEMLRGWAPAVEAHLAESVSPSRAARLALTYAPAFPQGYRNLSGPAEAASDVLVLNTLSRETERKARLYRHPTDPADRLRLKIYRIGEVIPLSEAVPVLENFGFRVVYEVPTRIEVAAHAFIHEFVVHIDNADDSDTLLARCAIVEEAIAATLEGRAENDAFNQLLVAVGLAPRDVVLYRAWFRYLRQTGLPYGLATVVDALRRAPVVARRIIDLFDARFDPARADARAAEAASEAIDQALASVLAIDDDRILRRLRALVLAMLRTNAFAPAGQEALAFKLDSAQVPGLPQPLPWREIWVYSPRVEGIHLRGGPIARGGLRWSDRRDDFRTEILGLMKAQLVKNAVIVPTGAKGGFYPKQLPSPANREAWLAEGTESYRSFIRTLLSLTDNIVDGKVVHPPKTVIHDGEDPYFVVAADKGTASFSDVANAIAIERRFWLGDAFASGGSQGYDHKAMGITARGAWISVQRHFLEMGIDVQTQPVRVAGCGDMSGDVFGNGMLLSKAIKLVAAFDHRHIFLDPDPDPAQSWQERARLFALPRSSWADYDAKLISKGGGIFPRSQKQIPLSSEVKALLDIDQDALDPSALVAAILRSPVDLLWFGGIGTYVKARWENNAEVGDPSNDAHRVNGEEVRAKAIGEGANLGVTQQGRIAYALHGGRINTDFIDNSAGVDCSDNEVNIKIALNREMAEGRLAADDRNALLARMTDDVAGIVLEDNRLQTLALSLAEAGGAAVLPAQVRVIEVLEAAGRINREVEGLESNEQLLRRAKDGQGLTRPELAVLLSHGKIALQSSIEKTDVPADPLLAPVLHAAFPPEMRDKFAGAIDAHRLRSEIVATKMANRVVNRLGLLAPFELAEEEGVALSHVAAAYFAADAIFGLEELWQRIEQGSMAEDSRLRLLDAASAGVRLHVSDLLRAMPAGSRPGDTARRLGDGIRRLDAATAALLRAEALSQSDRLRARIEAPDADPALVDRVVRLHELDGAVGTALLAADRGIEEVVAAAAYVRLGEALGLDWAKEAVLRYASSDPWERLLAAGLARDFEQLRLDFLDRMRGKDLQAEVESWLKAQAPRVAQFRGVVDRARSAPATSAAMLAQIAGLARVLLSR
jgi:glutamate dehydrogenase